MAPSRAVRVVAFLLTLAASVPARGVDLGGEPGDAAARMAQAERLDRREHRFTEALAAYRELVRAHPEQRLATRAKARADFLEMALAGGEEPLRLYEDTLASYRDLERGEAIRRMSDVIARFPEFPLRGRAMRWTARELAESGRRAEAHALYRAAIAELPGTDDAFAATAARGALLVRERSYREALALFHQLAELPAERWRRVGQDLAKSTRELMVRRAISIGSALVLVALVAVALRAVPWHQVRWSEILDLRRDLAIFLVPGALLLAVSRGAPPAVFRSVLTVVLGLPPLLALNRLLLEGARTRARRIAHLAMLVPALLALHYCVLYWNGLGEMLEHTLRFGPEDSG